jgi:pimeloyl-ACP methyl ester carboxylesterase
VTKAPFLLVPGLNCTEEGFKHVIPALWPFGAVTVANHMDGEGVAGIAANILRDAPPAFALLGFSMGGYIAFEILRQAPERVLKLCMLDSSARPDSPEAIEKRRAGIAKARSGNFDDAVSATFATAVHPEHLDRIDLKAIHMGMARVLGPEIYARHQEAIIARPDSRPDLPGIKVPTLIVVGDTDQITVPDAAREMHTGIADSKLVVIEKAGHLALLEQPLPVASAIRAWARS